MENEMGMELILLEMEERKLENQKTTKHGTQYFMTKMERLMEGMLMENTLKNPQTIQNMRNIIGIKAQAYGSYLVTLHYKMFMKVR